MLITRRQQIHICGDCGKPYARLYKDDVSHESHQCIECYRRRLRAKTEVLSTERFNSYRDRRTNMVETEEKRRVEHPSTMPELYDLVNEADALHISYGELVARRYMNEHSNDRKTDK